MQLVVCIGTAIQQTVDGVVTHVHSSWPAMMALISTVASGSVDMLPGLLVSCTRSDAVALS